MVLVGHDTLHHRSPRNTCPRPRGSAIRARRGNLSSRGPHRSAQQGYFTRKLKSRRSTTGASCIVMQSLRVAFDCRPDVAGRSAYSVWCRHAGMGISQFPPTRGTRPPLCIRHQRPAGSRSPTRHRHPSSPCIGWSPHVLVGSSDASHNIAHSYVFVMANAPPSRGQSRNKNPSLSLHIIWKLWRDPTYADFSPRWIVRRLSSTF